MFSVTSVVSLASLLRDPERSGSLTYDYDQNYDTLCDGAKRILDEENAGGSSTVSEAFSFHLICQILSNVWFSETEKTIRYWDPRGKITDYTFSFEKRRFAVQVTRAMYQPKDRRAPVKRITKEIEKKLKGIQDSSTNARHKWEKQILHVWCEDRKLSGIVRDVFENADTGLRGNTILLISHVQDVHRGRIFNNQI